MISSLFYYKRVPAFQTMGDLITKTVVNWNRVAKSLIYLILLIWIILFGICIPKIAHKMSGRCYRDTYDTGEATAKMLASLILMHGTWCISVLLIFIEDKWFHIILGAYICVGTVVGSVIGYVFAPPDACFVSYSDMYALLICANIIYIGPALVITLFILFSIARLINLIFILPGIWMGKWVGRWIWKLIPSYYIKEKTIEV